MLYQVFVSSQLVECFVSFPPFLPPIHCMATKKANSDDDNNKRQTPATSGSLAKHCHVSWPVEGDLWARIHMSWTLKWSRVVVVVVASTRTRLEFRTASTNFSLINISVDDNFHDMCSMALRHSFGDAFRAHPHPVQIIMRDATNICWVSELFHIFCTPRGWSEFEL